MTEIAFFILGAITGGGLALAGHRSWTERTERHAKRHREILDGLGRIAVSNERIVSEVRALPREMDRAGERRE